MSSSGGTIRMFGRLASAARSSASVPQVGTARNERSGYASASPSRIGRPLYPHGFTMVTSPPKQPRTGYGPRPYTGGCSTVASTPPYARTYSRAAWLTATVPRTRLSIRVPAALG